MKKLVLLITVFTFQYSTAQVGINTTTPNAQLEIKSNNQAAPSNTDGILIPKIDVFPASNPTAAQQGMLVYLTTVSGSNQPGFYYWNNNSSSWIAIAGSNSGWGLSGNSGTNASSNFIGTTDNIDMIFKRNNIKSGTIQSYNTALGVNSLSNNSSGSINSAYGTDSLKDNTTGIGNTAVGFSSSRSNFSGNNNTAIGNQSLDANTHGSSNVALGSLSQLSNVNGSFNTAVGVESLRNNSVSSITAVGYSSLRSNTTGTNNDAFGANALTNNTIGGFNSSFGESSLRYNTSGGANAAFGSSALLNNSNGSRNSALGFFSLMSNTSGGDNVAVGSDALSANTTGNGNVALGNLSLFSNSAGSFNTAVGLESLRKNTASSNTAVGYSSLRNNSTGLSNSAFGLNALLNSQNGNLNSAFGENSLIGNIMGVGNAAFGNESLQSNFSGSFNTAIGYNSDVASGNLLNATAVGANARVGASNSIVLGSISGVNSSFSNTNVGIGTITPLDRLHVVGNIRMVDGNQADGKVLISDANGTATWATPSTSGGTLDQAYDFGGAGAGKTITADSGAVTIAGNDGLVSTGTLNSGVIAPSGSGVRMVWNPRKAAFRAGSISGTQWDDTNIGTNSVGFGLNIIASGPNSVAMGNSLTASGTSSTAIGNGSIATGNFSTALGSSTANGMYSTAMGRNTVANGLFSTAIGNSTTSSGISSTSIGESNTAPSYAETVVGIGATTYTPSTNGVTQFRAANAKDRLFVIGNAIDTNNSNTVDTSERSDAMVVLKNGATGIGTSLPTGILDVNASDNGILIPRVFLSSVLVQAPIVNPQGGALPTSTLVYNNATAGVSPNNVYPGFYYWNGTRWIRFDVNGENNPTYYTAVGTSNDFTSSSFTLLDQMSITFTPKDDVVMVNFSAAGHRTDDSCAENAIFFQIVLNGIPVTSWQTATNQSIVNYGGIFGNDAIVTWDTNITYPVTVPIGISQTIQIQWYSTACQTFNNVGSPFTAFGAVFKSYRTLTIIDPNGGGGIIGAPPVTTNLWAHNGNTGTNATNFVGTADAQPLVLKSNNTEGIRIATNGRIGLGITAPLEKLHLSGKAIFENGFSADNAALVYKNNTDYMFLGPQSGSSANGGAVALFGSTNVIGGNAGGIDLNVASGQLRITSAGNVGIGSSSPQDKLHIVGNLRMVDGNQAAGKVLTSDINGTASWQNASNSAWGLIGNAGTSAATNFIGTSDDIDVVFKRNTIRSGLFGTTNSSFGLNALNIGSTGTNNTAIGVDALKTNTTGSNNTAVGKNAFSTINAGNNNTALGADTSTTSTIFENATAIGYKAMVGNSNVMVLGSINGVNGATSSVNVGIGTISPQTALEVVDANVVTSGSVEGNFNVMTNGAQAIDRGGSITLGGTINDTGTIFRTFGSIEGRKATATTSVNSGYLLFKTNNAGTLSERMRITNAGDIGIGTTAPGGQFELSLNEGRKPTSNTWTIPSDARLKNVNGIYEKGLAEILQLKPIRYNYKNTDKKTFDQKVLDKEAYGFLAQEVQTIFPEAVGTDPDGYLNFDLHPILIASVNALKELNDQNTQLKNENETLRSAMQQMEQKVAFILSKIENLKK